ncbi:MAG: TetR/AcrR family transcriptional regulator [Myxococcaceae bacterium]
MGSKERREREKTETRQLILETARQLFAEKGFEAVTMRMIADKIEYSPTAIYVHFADKDSLMRELCAGDFRSMSAAVVRAQKVEDPRDRLKKLGRAYLDFALDHPNSYMLLFMHRHERKALDKDEFDDPERSAYAMLKQAVQHAIDKGALHADHQDADQTAQLMWAGIHGLISLQFAMQNDGKVPWKPLKKMVDLMMDVLLEGFRSGSKH